MVYLVLSGIAVVQADDGEYYHSQLIYFIKLQYVESCIKRSSG